MLLPESDELHYDLIDYYTIGLTLRSHWEMIWQIISHWIIICSFYFITEKYRWAVTAILVLHIIDLMDYKLRFGEFLFHVWSYPVEYTLIKGIFMVLIISAVFIHDLYTAKN
jgi:hypothetical protein